MRLIDSGDYLSTAVSPQAHQSVVNSSPTMLQYLQPSSNAIQNMLIQQILTSPEQVREDDEGEPPFAFSPLATPIGREN